MAAAESLGAADEWFAGLEGLVGFVWFACSASVSADSWARTAFNSRSKCLSDTGIDCSRLSWVSGALICAGGGGGPRRMTLAA